MCLLCLRITFKGKRLSLKAPSALSNAMKEEKSLGAIFIRKKTKQKQKQNKKTKQKQKQKQDTNIRYIKNLSILELTQAQINLLLRGLNFIPTSVTNESHIRTQ